ncbi:uncharacterized protein LOC130591670 [Beta vulgaris subsp. vulgaris]|uniref:uncharacterized protein LOC130591670 n=1 Tax=Beta vulgaris subsp. vulgaris TaxID=3555 RepID=UPI002549A680|nr:uncharacterized protein LOC130591670 [Beta vulgaris subsp. vulgaris]
MGFLARVSRVSVSFVEAWIWFSSAFIAVGAISWLLLSGALVGDGVPLSVYKCGGVLVGLKLLYCDFLAFSELKLPYFGVKVSGKFQCLVSIVSLLCKLALAAKVSCVELPFMGSRFTWRKKKAGPNNILERIDKGVASTVWISKFTQARLKHHPFTSSDHCQVSLDLSISKSSKAPPFRFEKMWCQRKDYDTLVKKTWCTRFNGSHMFNLVKKCKLLKENSKKWNLSQFGNIFRQLRLVNSKLANIQERLIPNPLCSSLILQQERFLQKRENYYLLVVNIVSVEEIKAATFDLAPDKSPGPDGFPPFFFQKYWTLVGNSVVRAVKAFFHSGNILKEINHTFLALIPKIDNSSNANHFRPISLCSTIYKIISKVICNRLKSVMGKIIHPLQGAFVPERLIQDNILIAHEVFHSFSKKSGSEGWIAIKLDMEKAYDRLEWDYILVSLRKLGFCPQWIAWIKTCISTPSFSILVNGVPGDRFFPSRGIRQGDPLSPYLFILCAELLARQLSFANLQKDKSIGVSIGKSGVRIPFLTFADDTMILPRQQIIVAPLLRPFWINIVQCQPDSLVWGLTADGEYSVKSGSILAQESDGEVLLAGAKSLGSHVSIIQAEAWALSEGIKGASFLNISQLIVEGDNLGVINSMKNSWRIPWEISNIVKDAGMDALRFQMCEFRHCFREANKAADFMARKAHDFPSLLYWFPPYCMEFLLTSERMF